MTEYQRTEAGKQILNRKGAKDTKKIQSKEARSDVNS